MEIRVGKYILRSDPYCMWIEEEYVQKNGKTETKRIAGYSATLQLLLDSFLEHKYRNSDAKDLKELLKLLKQTLEDMSAIKKTASKEDFKLINKKIKEKK